MKHVLVCLLALLPVLPATAQSGAAANSPAAVVSATIEAVTGKRFQADTTFAALSDEDVTLLAGQPAANWGLAQEAGDMVYYNLVVGTRSYQLLVNRPAKTGFPVATLLRYSTPQSKPERLARGQLHPRTGEKVN